MTAQATSSGQGEILLQATGVMKRFGAPIPRNMSGANVRRTCEVQAILRPPW